MMRRKNISILFSLFAAVAVSAAQNPERKDTLSLEVWGKARTYDKTTGKTVSVGRPELERHAIGDVRNRLTGMLPGVDVTEISGGVYEAASGNFTSYDAGGSSNAFRVNGFNSLRLFVDDIPIPFNQILLEPNQIESVTVLSDVLDKSRLGPMASYGGLVFKTRRGEYNTPLRISVNVESGVNFIDRLPGWASGVDYAQLNNQLRTDAGLAPLYSEEAIAQFGQYNENDLLFPAVNYRNKMIKNAFSTTSFGFDASAGSQSIKYHIALNGLNYGDILNAEKVDYNKLNLTGNVTFKIGRYIETSAGIMGLLSFRRRPNINWYDYRSVPEVAYPLVLGTVAYSADTDADIASMVGSTIYGVSKTFTDNYYAKLVEGGRRTLRNRSGVFYSNINVDLGWLLPGLKSKTNILTSSFLSTLIGKSNDYIAQYWDNMSGEVKEVSTHKGTKQTARSEFSNTTSAILSLYERLYYTWEGKGHSIDAGLTYYQSSTSQTGASNPQKLQYFEADGSWSYKGRYNVELSAQYAGSHRYTKKARWGFFPTVGVSWIASNEDFLKNNRVLTNLKLYAQGGDIGQVDDLFSSPNLYHANYLNSSSITYGPADKSGPRWFGNNSMTSTITTMDRLANPDLTWQRLTQFNVGADLELLKCVTLRADWFWWNRYGNVADILANTPAVFGLTATIYDNYQSVVTNGFNFSAGFQKTWGDFSLNVLASATTYTQVYNKLVSDNYLYEYQKLTGSSTYAIRGFECLGKYTSQEEIDLFPSYVDKSSLRVGDLKYKDQNGDDVIDANDRVVIGSSNPKLRYMVNLSMKWKNLDFMIVGTGRTGADVNLAESSYFTGNTGMSNQSQFVIDQLGNELPRLNYYGVPNNEAYSTWWLRKVNWFKVQAVDLGYTLPLRLGNKLGLQSIRLDLRGSNLLTMTNLKYVDPEDFSAGLSRRPFFREVTFGVKLYF